MFQFRRKSSATSIAIYLLELNDHGLRQL